MDIKNKTQVNINKNQTLKRAHAESGSDDDSNQTLSPSFIVLESIEDTLITKLSPFIIEKKS